CRARSGRERSDSASASCWRPSRTARPRAASRVFDAFPRREAAGLGHSRAMPQLSFVTTVGSTADVRASRADVILVTEPETGATLRTKGRLYLLFEASPPGPPATHVRGGAELPTQEDNN